MIERKQTVGAEAWHCRNCGVPNFPERLLCHKCSAFKDEDAKKEWATRGQQNTKSARRAKKRAKAAADLQVDDDAVQPLPSTREAIRQALDLPLMGEGAGHSIALLEFEDTQRTTPAALPAAPVTDVQGTPSTDTEDSEKVFAPNVRAVAKRSRRAPTPENPWADLRSSVTEPPAPAQTERVPSTDDLWANWRGTAATPGAQLESTSHRAVLRPNWQTSLLSRGSQGPREAAGRQEGSSWNGGRSWGWSDWDWHQGTWSHFGDDEDESSSASGTWSWRSSYQGSWAWSHHGGGGWGGSGYSLRGWR